jgi:hypothetical protein
MADGDRIRKVLFVERLIYEQSTAPGLHKLRKKANPRGLTPTTGNRTVLLTYACAV